MRGADLREANLEEADLSLVSLFEADLGAANLQGMWYNNFTQWPAEFDPVEAGAVFQY